MSLPRKLLFHCIFVAMACSRNNPTSHPLDPLSEDELDITSSVLREQGHLRPGVFLPHLALDEPSKPTVKSWTPGAPVDRRALAVLLDRANNVTSEAIIDVLARRIISFEAIPGAHPGILQEEFDQVQDIVRSDARWREAMRRRGIDDFENVRIDVWAGGHLVVPGLEGRRLLRGLSFHQGEGVNAYGRPVEGVVAIIDTSTGRVAELIDTGVVPLPSPGVDFFDPAQVGPTRKLHNRMTTRLRRGAGFELHGHAIAWDNWQLRWALHPREGLVLYDVHYDDGGQKRSILHRASIAEMVVPYGDPAAAWAWRSAFDAGEYGLGRLANTLRPGREVPDHATLIDACFADDHGTPYTRPDVVAIYERDGGIIWTHSDHDAGRVETRRGRELVLAHIVTVGNYDYEISWVLRQDGELEIVIGLSGILLAKGATIQRCQACRVQRGPQDEDRFGTFVAPGIVAPNHQHFFNFRFDFDIDGVENSVVEIDVRPDPPREDNPYQNGFRAERTLLRRESSGARQANPLTDRAWEVIHTTALTRLGHNPGYLVTASGSVSPYLADSAPLRRWAPFLQHTVAITRQRDHEIYSAGEYRDHHDAETGLARWIADDEDIVGQDVVVWYTLGVTHVPRPEDWPVMNMEYASVTLSPNAFFARNPALDLR